MSKKQQQRAKTRSAMKSTAKKHPLVGLFFHTFQEVDGKRTVQYQGYIKDVSAEGVLTQLFEWFVGSPSNMKWFPLAAVEEWELYSSTDEMNEAYEHKYAPRK